MPLQSITNNVEGAEKKIKKNLLSTNDQNPKVIIPQKEANSEGKSCKEGSSKQKSCKEGSSKQKSCIEGSSKQKSCKEGSSKQKSCKEGSSKKEEQKENPVKEVKKTYLRNEHIFKEMENHAKKNLSQIIDPIMEQPFSECIYYTKELLTKERRLWLTQKVELFGGIFQNFLDTNVTHIIVDSLCLAKSKQLYEPHNKADNRPKSLNSAGFKVRSRYNKTLNPKTSYHSTYRKSKINSDYTSNLTPNSPNHLMSANHCSQSRSHLAKSLLKSQSTNRQDISPAPKLQRTPISAITTSATTSITTTSNLKITKALQCADNVNISSSLPQTSSKTSKKPSTPCQPSIFTRGYAMRQLSIKQRGSISNEIQVKDNLKMQKDSQFVMDNATKIPLRDFIQTIRRFIDMKEKLKQKKKVRVKDLDNHFVIRSKYFKPIFGCLHQRKLRCKDKFIFKKPETFNFTNKEKLFPILKDYRDDIKPSTLSENANLPRNLNMENNIFSYTDDIDEHIQLFKFDKNCENIEELMETSIVTDAESGMSILHNINNEKYTDYINSFELSEGTDFNNVTENLAKLLKEQYTDVKSKKRFASIDNNNYLSTDIDMIEEYSKSIESTITIVSEQEDKIINKEKDKIIFRKNARRIGKDDAIKTKTTEKSFKEEYCDICEEKFNSSLETHLLNSKHITYANNVEHFTPLEDFCKFELHDLTEDIDICVASVLDSRMLTAHSIEDKLKLLKNEEKMDTQEN